MRTRSKVGRGDHWGLLLGVGLMLRFEIKFKVNSLTHSRPVKIISVRSITEKIF